MCDCHHRFSFLHDESLNEAGIEGMNFGVVKATHKCRRNISILTAEMITVCALWPGARQGCHFITLIQQAIGNLSQSHEARERNKKHLTRKGESHLATCIDDSSLSPPPPLCLFVCTVKRGTQKTARVHQKYLKVTKLTQENQEQWGNGLRNQESIRTKGTKKKEGP